jgi:hypothetical protein
VRGERRKGRDLWTEWKCWASLHKMTGQDPQILTDIAHRVTNKLRANTGAADERSELSQHNQPGMTSSPWICDSQNATVVTPPSESWPSTQ